MAQGRRVRWRVALGGARGCAPWMTPVRALVHLKWISLVLTSRRPWMPARACPRVGEDECDERGGLRYVIPAQGGIQPLVKA